MGNSAPKQLKLDDFRYDRSLDVYPPVGRVIKPDQSINDIVLRVLANAVKNDNEQSINNLIDNYFEHFNNDDTLALLILENARKLKEAEKLFLKLTLVNQVTIISSNGIGYNRNGYPYPFIRRIFKDANNLLLVENIMREVIKINKFNIFIYKILCECHQNLAIDYIRSGNMSDPQTNSILYYPCLHRSIDVIAYIKKSIDITPEMINYKEMINYNYFGKNCISACATNEMVDEFKLLVEIFYKNQQCQPVKRFSPRGQLLLEMCKDNNTKCTKCLLDMWPVEEILLGELAKFYSPEITNIVTPFLKKSNDETCGQEGQPHILNGQPPGGI